MEKLENAYNSALSTENSSNHTNPKNKRIVLKDKTRRGSILPDKK